MMSEEKYRSSDASLGISSNDVEMTDNNAVSRPSTSDVDRASGAGPASFNGTNSSYISKSEDIENPMNHNHNEDKLSPLSMSLSMSSRSAKDRNGSPSRPRVSFTHDTKGSNLSMNRSTMNDSEMSFSKMKVSYLDDPKPSSAIAMPSNSPPPVPGAAPAPPAVPAALPAPPAPAGDKVTLFGCEMILPKEYLIVCLLSYNFGYIDANTFRRFRLYTAMMTGNMVQLSVFLSTGDTSDLAYCICTIFSNFVIGVSLGVWLADIFKSKTDPQKTRKKALSCIVFLIVASSIGLDALEYAQKTSGRNYGGSFRYVSLVIAASNGALLPWATKLIWSTALMTLNGQKFVEAMYNRFIMKIPAKFSPKILGDNFTIASLVISFNLGAITSSFVVEYTTYFSLFPYIFVTLVLNEIAGFANISVWFRKKKPIQRMFSVDLRKSVTNKV